jgi:hypothetical protein
MILNKPELYISNISIIKVITCQHCKQIVKFNLWKAYD